MGQQFMRVEEVAEILDVSTSYAYKVIRELNEELKRKGFITISGRVNREYFNERLYQARKPAQEFTTTCSTVLSRLTPRYME